MASTAWAAIARSARERAGRCEYCGSTDSLEVHHVNYLRFGGRELADDLNVLCRGAIGDCMTRQRHGG
jgi:5-methylcytosine-specific restriction endonuclease McrA